MYASLSGLAYYETRTVLAERRFDRLRLIQYTSGGSYGVNIISFNPGHDGAIAYLKDAHLLVSIEAEKNSNYRYSPISSHDVFNALGEVDHAPDVICTGGWWPRERHVLGSQAHAGYRGVLPSDFIVEQRRLLGRRVDYFSSSHERSHLLCAFGMSSLPKGTPCYALVWEGAIGAFYEIDSELNITLLADVLSQAGNRYILIYGLADPTFPKNAPFSRFSDAGKLMALAAFANRSTPSVEEQKLIEFLLNCPRLEENPYNDLVHSPYYNVGVNDEEFRNFTGIVSDKIFDVFYRFAKANMKKRMPLLIAGGCGLNCDWNTKWRESNLFSEVFVPPVANDSGSAIGTAIDAQFYFTGNPKIDWSVYSGLDFITAGSCDLTLYDVYETNYEMVADMLANDLIVGWVSGKYEIGPRALGNRSILAAPFQERTRVRLNEMKQREQFRPIAPVCLEEEAARWFGCDQASPFMLYTYRVRTDALAAVTHVNGTARLETVSSVSNRRLYELLVAFKARTGYGVLCNTSLNFNGRGFINKLADLAAYAEKHELDGFVVEQRTYLLKSSKSYQAYLRMPNSMTADRRIDSSPVRGSRDAR
jgi:predicted NodU family carbamoyl transferase